MTSILFSCGPRTGVHEEVPKQNLYVPTIKDSAYKRILNNGEKIFKQNCASCHCLIADRCCQTALNKTMERYPSKEWFINYTLNNEKVFESGDPYATLLKKNYGGASMPIFEGILSKYEVLEVYVFLAKSKE